MFDKPTMKMSETTKAAVNAMDMRPGYVRFTETMCKQRRVEFDESRCTNYADAKAYQDELRTIPFWKPATENQIAAFKNLAEQLEGYSEPDWANTSIQEASDLIVALLETLKNTPRKASEKQINLIKEMQLCPDCYTVSSDELDNMSTEDASEYIGKFRRVYYAWKATRPDDAMINRILKVAENMGSPLTYAAVIQFSKIGAEEYYKQLCHELSEAVWKETTLEPEYEGRDADTYKETYDEEYETLKALYCRLFAAIGQQVEEESLINMDFDDLKDLCDTVKEYCGNIYGFFENVPPSVLTEKEIAYLCRG